MSVRVVLTLVLAAGCLTGPNHFEWPYNRMEIRGDVHLQARAALRQDTVVVSVQAYNRGGVRAEIDTGSCPFGVVATGPGGSLWSNRPPTGPHCTDNQVIYFVQPGQTREFLASSVRWSTIRGSRPNGIYRWTVYYRDDEGRHDVPAGALLLP